MPSHANWYHCSVKTVSRKSGRSAVAAAAYRLGQDLTDYELTAVPQRDAVAAAAYRAGIDLKSDESAIARYSGRKDGVVTWFIVAPENSPGWAYDPEQLWNHAMAKDKRKNSITAREVELALPAALTSEERQQVALDYAEDLVDRYGVAVQVAIHKPSSRGDQRNFHAHILMTTRRMGPDGLTGKTRELDDLKGSGPSEIEWIREHAAFLINEALERAGLAERVSHLSYEDLGIAREPTEHLGPDATEMERNGERTEKGDKNREIQDRNRAQEDLERAIEDYARAERDIAEREQRKLDERYGPAEDAPLPEDNAGSSPRDRARELNDEDRIIEEESRAFDEQLRANGEIRHEGIGFLRWHWEAFVAGAVHVIDAAVDFLRDKWQQYVVDRRGRDDIEPDEPDMGR